MTLSRHGAVELDWADGTYTFRLGLEQIEELEEKCGGSIFAVRDRLLDRQPRLRDMREPLRIGLIGGGKPPVDALKLVRRYIDERPLDENREFALAVILAGLARVHADEIESAFTDKPAEPVRMDFRRIFVMAAKMGIADPMSLSLGQWHGAVSAWNEMQGGVRPPTEEEFDRAVGAA